VTNAEQNFGANILRANSKFCPICGKELSDFIKQGIARLKKATRAAGDRTKRKRVDNDETGVSYRGRKARGRTIKGF
jgi:hypothetical protein